MTQQLDRTDAPTYPGIPGVINGNGAIAHVMKHVCGGVIGYPITPSTEVSELYEAARAEGGVNVWGKHPFFFEPEGEHSAQSGALGAALTGGQFISNASSSQGILYAMESHYVTVGKKIGGFVLQVAARVVSKHSLNVMAGHDDVYALLSAGYTVLFGSNPQEAADLAAIAYRTSALSLIPVANAMDGFSTSHMLSEARMPEPELLKEYLGDPAGRIPAPTVAQELLFGAKGRVYQLTAYLQRHRDDIGEDDVAAITEHLEAHADQVELDDDGDLIGATLDRLPTELHGQWRRQWRHSLQKGTRQLVPALVDVHNPGLTGPVQNQPDFQAGAVDHRTHFANAVPSLVRQAMDEYSALTGRPYSPIHTYGTEDADYVMVGLGSITDDVRAVLPVLRERGLKVGAVSVKLLQPFPEAEVIDAIGAAKAVTVLERSDQTALTSLVTQALFKARANADAEQYPGISAISAVPRMTTAIFGLGGHDVQPRHLVAAFQHMADGGGAPLVYLGSQFFSKTPSAYLAEIQERLRAAYPETELMALETEDNPVILPPEAMRIRFHSVGGYGTIATGKLLTDVLAGVLGMHSKSAPKYGSEKSGAPTNYYITLSPEPVLVTNAELEDVEVVVSPDHKAFIHTNPLKGMVAGGTFVLQSDLTPEQVWRELPQYARRTIRDKKIRFLVVDAFKVAKQHAPIPELELRMMGIAFIGAVVGHVDQVAGGATPEAIQTKVRGQIEKKFGTKGEAVVEANMAVIADGMAATEVVDYDSPGLLAIDVDQAAPHVLRTVAMSAAMCGNATSSGASGLFDPGYYEDMTARPFREGTIGEAPVLPGIGLFMPAGTAGGKDKGLFRRTVPAFDFSLCTGCLECTLVCPDAAIPNTVHEVHDLLLAAIDALEVSEAQRQPLRRHVYELAERVRASYRADRTARPFDELVAGAVEGLYVDNPTEERNLAAMVAKLAAFPVARTRPFFDAMEKETPGTGGLFSAVVDPWKCTGCLECIEVCGPGALSAIDQDADVLSSLQERFDLMSTLPSTPKRFLEGSTTLDGDLKRLLLDRPNFYATTGGHGACRGCGEVTAIRLVMATNHALGEERRRMHLKDLDEVLAGLHDKLEQLGEGEDTRERRARISGIVSTLERRLYFTESGPTGNGPAPTVIANATGCSSVYASTMPFNSYLDPWVNSLFQDTQPLAKGIFEGISAQAAGDVRALRLARLELEDAYDPARHERALRTLSWEDFTLDELALLPTVMTIGGDGASYDIGFGAMSRVLASDTPIKVLVLNSGAYSNTGGQASTSSFTGQDSDLSRFGGAHHGKHETRKELGLLASFHPNVYVCATSTALHGHFLRATMELLGYPAPAVMDVYTPCGSEHGVSEASSNARARLAVESRMHPLFVHDPRRGGTLHDWFSLDGNPDLDQTWTTSTLQYLDEEGNLQLKNTPLTPAEFALGETRFKKQFERLDPQDEANAVPIDEYVEIPQTQRGDRVPFVYATDEARHLMKVACSSSIVSLVEDRRRYWQTLQYLSGVHEAQLTALHRADFEELRQRYEEATQARETSLDDIARAMSELAASSGAPAPAPTAPLVGGATLPVRQAEAAPAVAGTPERPVFLDPAEEVLCNDCGTCYQELPQFFEKVTKIFDGEARPVAQMIAGSLESVQVTEAIQKRIDRVRANCDAEIIR